MISLKTLTRRLAAIAACAVMLLGLSASPALAANTNSIYSYNFAGAQGTIANDAAKNSSVTLRLRGQWNPLASGVYFNGNQSNAQSVGYANPSSGATLNVAANQSVGAAVAFTYLEPSSGTCFSDSANITQIGRFGAKVGQVKLQLSNCGKHKTSVFIQCRVAGANSGTNVAPKTSSQPLVHGQRYVAQCIKAPDPSSGDSSIEINTIKLDSYGNLSTTDTFSVDRTGKISSYAYLSVANKYPLPSIAKNTDQFVGEVSRVAYCQASTLQAARTCLDQEVPAQF